MSSLLCGLSMCSDSRNNISESNIQNRYKPKNDNQNKEIYQAPSNESLSNIASVIRPSTAKSSFDSHWSQNTFVTETDNTLKQRKRSKSRVRSRSIHTKIGTVLLFETDAMEIKGEETVDNNDRESKPANENNHNYRKYRTQNEKYNNNNNNKEKVLIVVNRKKEHQCKHKHRHKHGNKMYLNNQREQRCYNSNNNNSKNRRNSRRNSISHSLSDHRRKSLYRLSFENESDDIDDKFSTIGNASITPRRNSISTIQRSSHCDRGSMISQQTRITPSYSIGRSSICSKDTLSQSPNRERRQSTSSMYVEDTDNESMNFQQESVLEKIWEENNDDASMPETPSTSMDINNEYYLNSSDDDQSSMTETESHTPTKYVFLDKGVVKSVIV